MEMNPLINLVHLKFFCDTVVYQSISESAKVNYITQSAVSQAISKLESVFGVPLIIHNKQKLIVTEEGRIVFNQATEIFKAVKETFDQVNQTKEEISGVVRFVTTKSLGMSFLAPLYSGVKEKFPSVDLSFFMGGKNAIRTALKREDVEFAFVVYDHNFSQFAKVPLRKGLFHLYQTKKNNDEIFIDESEGMYVQQLKDFLASTDHSYTLKEIAGWELVANFANLGMGIGFIPDYLIASKRFANLQLHPVKLPPFEYEIAAIYNKSTKLSRTAQAVIEQFTEQ
jgi:LysR family carnitine catabolism transcriptional activator